MVFPSVEPLLKVVPRSQVYCESYVTSAVSHLNIGILFIGTFQEALKDCLYVSGVPKCNKLCLTESFQMLYSSGYRFLLTGTWGSFISAFVAV